MKSAIMPTNPSLRDEAPAACADERPMRPPLHDRDESSPSLEDLLGRALELGFTPAELGALIARPR
jgi:hypothetical protein